MKINPISNPNILKSYQATRSVTEKNKASGGRDQVSFSQEALNFSKALSDAREMLEARTPVEQQHISNIASAVRDGSYRVSSEDIAAKILESVKGRV